jgi:hypothetical protein
MPNFKLIALSSPVDGQESEYNTWYDGQHIRDLLAIPSIKSAKRYQRILQLNGDNSSTYLAIYDVECDDAESFLAAFGPAASNFVPSDAIIPGYIALYAEHNKE